MYIFVAGRTERDQIRFRVISAQATELLVVDLQLGHAATGLATPSITLQHLVSQLGIGFGIKPQRNRLGSDAVHAACSAMASRRLCL